MNAARVMKETGCGAIKVEGGRRLAETIAFLTERGVPVMGHVGLTPQSINTIGSFRAQGREEKDWGPIEDDAKSVAEAGAFSVVIEAVAEPLARRITEQVAIPTIGIGASAACDGQILVLEDMLGLSPRVPKFVKRYGDIGPGIEAAVAGYATRRARARLSRARPRLWHEEEVVGFASQPLLTVLRRAEALPCGRHIDYFTRLRRPCLSRRRCRGTFRVGYFPRSRRGSTPRAVPEALGALWHLRDRGGCPPDRRGRRLARLPMVRGEDKQRRPARRSRPP